MIFTKIRLVARTNVDFPIVGAKPSDIFILKAVDGLGPPEGDVTTTGRRSQLREVVMRIGLNPNYYLGQTVSSIREILYGLLTPGNLDGSIDLQIMNEEVLVAHAPGFIKRIEINPFAKEPEAQITFSSTETYLLAPPVIWSTPVMTHDTNYTYFSVQNIGNAPSGFSMSVVFTDDFTASFQIHGDADTPFSPILSILHPFSAGDALVVSTGEGSRSIVKTPSGGEDVSILGSYSSGPWLQLYGGLNNLKINCPDLEWGFGFSYQPAYWGV